MNGIRFVLPLLHFCQGPFTQGLFTTIIVCPKPCLLHCHMEKKMYKCGRDIIYGILTSLCIEGFPLDWIMEWFIIFFFKPKGLTLANAMPYDCEMMNCEYHTMFLLMLNIHVHYFKISNIKVSIYWELNPDHWSRGHHTVCHGDLWNILLFITSYNHCCMLIYRNMVWTFFYI